MQVTVKVMGDLIKIVGYSSFTVELQKDATIKGLLEELFILHGEDFKKEVMDKEGRDLAPYYKVLVNGRNAKLLGHFETVLENGQTIHIMPPIAGG